MRIRSVLCLTCCLAFIYGRPAAEITVTGSVCDQSTDRALAGVNIYCGTTGTTSDSSGRFVLTVPASSELTFAHIGYRTVTRRAATEFLAVMLEPVVLPGRAVYVSAIRAVEGVTPVAFSTLTPEEIQANYTVEDVPLVLAREPGVYAYGESGNGTGYSYVSIRGFDQSRVAVLLDNVPLNDNESHQVYWVDHGDILSDARDVQIQRGVGNSLYGSSAFGGSINVTTELTTERPGFGLQWGTGSYNTGKFSVRGQSGPLLDNDLQVVARYSQVTSDGYRENHHSRQRAFFGGVSYAHGKLLNQFRALIGYENTDLAWWGVDADAIDDRTRRRAGYEAYTDDFLQQIYSLNTTWQARPAVTVHNVAYLVRGAGYYRNQESAGYDSPEDKPDYLDFLWSYNLDGFYPDYPFPDDSAATLDFTRRKWIVNTYYGVIPTLTVECAGYRLDIGGELRTYDGNHFGQIGAFSDPALTAAVDADWYKYYQYYGRKNMATGFIHLTLLPLDKLRLVADLQYQTIRWTLDQRVIGHAAGHQLSADWQFLNPRLGVLYSLSRELTLFANYGRAQKEPADNQIIEADDVFGTPVLAAAELIDDYELGASYHSRRFDGTLNCYRIDYRNEQLKNIDVEQEGEYAYYSAAATRHAGVELELTGRLTPDLSVGINGSLNRPEFTGGADRGKTLPGIPLHLFNAWGRAALPRNWMLTVALRHVGRQYMPAYSAAVSDQTVPAFTVVDVGLRRSFGVFEAAVKVNNLFDVLYSTSGYDYDGWLYYWPGATRNAYFSLAVKF